MFFTCRYVQSPFQTIIAQEIHQKSIDAITCRPEYKWPTDYYVHLTVKGLSRSTIIRSENLFSYT